jgi:hypothetical protein
MQAAKYGGEEDSPTKLVNDIADTRNSIEKVMRNLSKLGMVVADDPIDKP